MAAQYALISNAFRQPNLADTYISLIVEAMFATGNPYTVPRGTLYITNYLAVMYPLFPIDATYLNTQLNRAVKLGVLARCVDDWLLRQDMLQVNVGNQKYLFGRCGVGKPLITTTENYPAGSRSPYFLCRQAGGSSAGNTKQECCTYTTPFGGCDASQGCCPPIPVPMTNCCGESCGSA
jgi:hypothetical protein